MEEVMYERPITELKYIVVHHSATPEDFSVEDIRKIHLAEGFSDIGYHFLVNKEGMHPGRDIKYKGAHAIGEKGTIPEPNRYAIGICLIGSFEHDDPSPKLINELAYAVKILAAKYNIPRYKTRILGHKDVDSTACPGLNTMKLLYKKIKI